MTKRSYLGSIREQVSQELDCHDDSQLLKAASLRRLRLTRLLVEGGANVNIKNMEGHTALVLCCISTSVDEQSAPKIKLAKYLLCNGADPNITDRYGKTAIIHVAERSLGVGLADLLLQYGADPTVEDAYGKNPLTYASQGDDRLLLTQLSAACLHWERSIFSVSNFVTDASRPQIRRYMLEQAVLQSTKSVLDIPAWLAGKAPFTSDEQMQELKEEVKSPEEVEKVNVCVTTECELDVPDPPCPRQASPLSTKGGSTRSHSPLFDDSVLQGRVSKVPPHQRVLKRRQTTDAVHFHHILKEESLPSERIDLCELRSKLLRWEKLISTRGASENDLTADETVGDLSLPDVVGQKRKSNKDPQKIHGKNRKSSRERATNVVGPRGEVLERQGSGTKLNDLLSQTRPGKLPVLNRNTTDPIPAIISSKGNAPEGDTSCHNDECLTGFNFTTKSNEKEISSEKAKEVSSKPERRSSDCLLSNQPDYDSKSDQGDPLPLNKKEYRRRKFFAKKSQTVELGERLRMLTLEDSQRASQDVSSQSMGTSRMCSSIFSSMDSPGS